jgi:hypothetical protein
MLGFTVKIFWKSPQDIVVACLVESLVGGGGKKSENGFGYLEIILAIARWRSWKLWIETHYSDVPPDNRCLDNCAHGGASPLDLDAIDRM